MRKGTDESSNLLFRLKIATPGNTKEPHLSGVRAVVQGQQHQATAGTEHAHRQVGRTRLSSVPYQQRTRARTAQAQTVIEPHRQPPRQ